MHSQATPFLHQNKPSRELIFCGQVNDWWTEKALRMLKILPNTRQKRLPHTHVHGQRHGKRIRLRMLRRAVKGHALKVNTTLTYKLKNSPTYKFKSNSPTQQKSRTHQFEPISSNIKTPKSSLTYKLKLINLKTHQLTSSNSPTQILTNL